MVDYYEMYDEINAELQEMARRDIEVVSCEPINISSGEDCMPDVYDLRRTWA